MEIRIFWQVKEIVRKYRYIFMKSEIKSFIYLSIELLSIESLFIYWIWIE